MYIYQSVKKCWLKGLLFIYIEARRHICDNELVQVLACQMLYVKPFPDAVQSYYQVNPLELILLDLTHWCLGDLNKILDK